MNNCFSCLYCIQVDKNTYCNRKILDTRDVVFINSPELECPCHSSLYREESRNGFHSLDSKNSYDVCQHCNRSVKDSKNLKIINDKNTLGKLRVCNICYDKYFRVI